MKRITMPFFAVLLALTTVVSFSSCSKDDKKENPSNSTAVQTTDIQISNITTDFSTPGFYKVQYDIKNTSTKNYSISTNGVGNTLHVLWEIKATDNTVYTQDDYVPNPFNAGVTTGKFTFIIGVPTGKVLTASTLKYTVNKGL